MLRWTTLAICALLFACGQENPTCTKGDHCVHYLSGLPGSPGTGGNGAAVDMAHAAAAPDMAHAPSTDMAQPASTDMAHAASTDMAGACVGPGGDCTYHNNAVCCSGYCIYASNTCK